jgi:hypothetical protein
VGSSTKAAISNGCGVCEIFSTLGRLALRVQADALSGGFTRTFERHGAWIDRGRIHPSCASTGDYVILTQSEGSEPSSTETLKTALLATARSRTRFTEDAAMMARAVSRKNDWRPVSNPHRISSAGLRWRWKCDRALVVLSILFS